MLERRLKLVVDNNKKDLPSLKPRFEMPRHRCPFYGFIFSSNVNTRAFIEAQANLCGLSQKKVGPCVMETLGQEVDWQGCEINTRFGKNIVAVLSEINFFPQEFWPDGGGAWPGIPYEEWERYVMAVNTPRPEKE